MRIACLQLDRATLVAFVFGIGVTALVASVGIVVADEPVTQSSQPDKVSSIAEVDTEPKSTSSTKVLPKEKRKKKAFQLRRKIVLDFVGQHFPELQESLLKSEKKSPSKFKHAVSRLEVDVVHLRKVEQRNPKKFELMAKQWKLKTQIEITIARYAKKETNIQLEERLSPLVEQMLDLRTSIFELEREFAIKRIDIMDERLLHVEKNRERIIKNNLRAYQMSANKIRDKQENKLLQRQALKSEAKAGSESQPPEE